jgi:putative thioredoxin
MVQKSKNYSKINFEERVLKRSIDVPVILEISMNYCGPCLWLEKILKDLVSAYEGQLDLVCLSINDYPELKERFDLRRNPTTILFMGGKEKTRFTGALPAYAIEQWIDDWVGAK